MLHGRNRLPPGPGYTNREPQRGGDLEKDVGPRHHPRHSARGPFVTRNCVTGARTLVLVPQRPCSADGGEQREPWSAEVWGLPSGAALPPPRVLLRVHAGHDDDGVTVDTVKEPIRKAPRDENAAGVPMKDGEGFWMFKHAVARQSQRRQEFFAQARPLRLVPLIGVLDVSGSRWPDDDLLHGPRLRIRLRTSSHGMPTGPSRSRSSRRRSSSAR